VVTRRLGGDTHDHMGWTLLSVLLPLAILPLAILPLAAVAPAWVVVTAGALVTLVIIGLAKLIDRHQAAAAASAR
jgi:hypothetical protein